MKISANFFLKVAFFFLLFLLIRKSALAATLSLSPASGDYQVGNTFSLNIVLNTEEERTTGTDVLLDFISSKDIVGAISIDFESYLYPGPTTYKRIYAGEIRLGEGVSDPYNFYEGEGNLAKITFQAKAAGTATLSFTCTPGETNDSNVFKFGEENEDILSCNKLVTYSYQIGGVTTPTPTPTSTPGPTATPTPTLPPGVPTSTPTPTSTPGPTSTPTPTPGAGVPTSTPTPVQKLPETGIVANTLILGIIGGGLILLGLSLAF